MVSIIFPPLLSDMCLYAMIPHSIEPHAIKQYFKNAMFHRDFIKNLVSPYNYFECFNEIIIIIKYILYMVGPVLSTEVFIAVGIISENIKQCTQI